VPQPPPSSGRPRARRTTTQPPLPPSQKPDVESASGKSMGATGVSGSSSKQRLGASNGFKATGGLGATGGKRMGASSGFRNTGGLGGTTDFGATGGLGGTGLVKELCVDAVAAAMDQAFGSLVDQSLEAEDEDQEQCGSASDAGEDAAEEPMSPSLMSVCQPTSPTWSPMKQRGSPRADSPSLLIIDDIGPLWTSHKPLPKPQTPPRSARKERAVLLGVPQPLSARARCKPDGEQPLSARGPRPGGRAALGKLARGGC